MSWAPVVLAALAADPFAAFQQAAASRQPSALMALAGPEVSAGDAVFLGRPGSFGVGRKGWTALPLDGLDGEQYAVFSTPLTTQDFGEPLFLVREGRLARRLPELDTLGWRPKTVDFQINLTKASKMAVLRAEVTLHRGQGRYVFFRLSPNYTVSRASARYRQAGGVVMMEMPDGPEPKVWLEYFGTVDQPEYAGAIDDTEAMLTNDIWWPSLGRLPFPFTAKVEAPPGEKVFMNGVETAPGRYRCDLPVNWLSLTVGPHKVTRVGDFYAASLNMEEADRIRQARMYAPVWEFFSRWAKPPFKGYGALESPLYGGGALEAYSHATYGEGWLPDEDAHEPSHTWWGGLIPNSYLKSFWNESFAVWSEGAYARRGPIGLASAKQAAFVQVPRISPSWEAAPLIASGADIGPASGDLGYGKGGYVLQQLEFEMGSEKLDEACRKWLATHPKGSLGEWEDFERAAGPQWKWFFDQWLRRTGAPEFELKNVAQSGGRLTGEAVFKGKPYRLKVGAIIRLKDGGERRVAIDLIPQGQTAKFEIACPPADSITLDPWRRAPAIRRATEPLSWARTARGFEIITDPARPEWKPTVSGRGRGAAGKLYCGHPDTSPEVSELASELGFEVTGDTLTYRGRKYDLKRHAAYGVMATPEGGLQGVWIGRTDLAPRTGASHAGVVDELGRFLDGATLPVTTGDWVAEVRDISTSSRQSS